MITTFARLDLGHGRMAFGRVEGDTFRVLADAPWVRREETGEALALSSGRLLAPVLPSKIVCVGRNYRAHANELGHEVPKEPLLFFKPPSSIVGPDEPIVLPRASSRVDHEAELGVVIGSRARNVTHDDALRHVFGFVPVNDVTARDLQKKDGQWARAKGFDTFCPTGPFIVAGLDPSSLDVRCRVNGESRQHGNTADMMFGLAELLVYISGIMTLEPGDLIATGTPSGVGPLGDGDVVEVEIAHLGVLRSPVRSAD